MKKTLLLFVFILVGFCVLHAQVIFNIDSLRVGGSPSGIVGADLNGDGNPDIAVATSASNSVSVFLGDGKGNFGAATSFQVCSHPYGLVTADFSGDGKPDLATVSSVHDTLAILTNNGSGSFTTSYIKYFYISGYCSIATADFTGDGKMDFILSCGGTNTFNVFTGNGAGVYTSVGSNSSLASDGAMQVADFNEDGKPDFAITHSASSTSIFYNTGGGSFKKDTTLVGVGGNGFIARDLNGDSHIDLALIGGVGVTFYPGNGKGNFGAAVMDSVGMHFGSYFSKYSLASLTSSDFNGDGYPDIATANNGTMNVSILLGNGTGYFTDTTFSTTTSYNGSSFVTAADFNKDGKPDIAFDGNVYVLMNGTPTGINDPEIQQNSSVYPNPFSESATLKINSVAHPSVFRLYDVLGKEVKQISITSPEVILERNGLENGIYFYRVIENEKVISRGKLIVR